MPMTVEEAAACAAHAIFDHNHPGCEMDEDAPNYGPATKAALIAFLVALVDALEELE